MSDRGSNSFEDSPIHRYGTLEDEEEDTDRLRQSLANQNIFWERCYENWVPCIIIIALFIFILSIVSITI